MIHPRHGRRHTTSSETTVSNRRRRGRGEGSIYQRADGRWTAAVTIGTDQNGRQVRRYVYGGTKGEVQKQLAAIQHSAMTGTLTEPSRATLGQYLAEWLENSVRSTVRVSTYRNYKRSVDNHITPNIGAVPLAKLSALNIQTLYATLQKTICANTIRTSRIVLVKALEQAVRWRLLNRNPAKDAKAPKVEHREMRTFTPEQATMLLKAAEGDRLRALFVLAITTGMRQSELTGLQWSDIDFDVGRLSVVRTASRDRAEVVVDAPKTAKSRRVIDLPAMAIEALHEHRMQSMREGLGAIPWVFCTNRGTVFGRSTLHLSHWRKVLAAAGLPRLRFHDMRHTCASLLLSADTHPKVVQERLGHSSVAITMDVYSHLLPTMQRDASAKIEAILTRPPANSCHLAVKTG